MPTDQRWLVFVDDSGDPGEHGGSHFGYAALGLTRGRFTRFVEQRARFRVARGIFHEPKGGNVHSDMFREVIDGVRQRVLNGDARAAASFIMKEHYEGAWLRDRPGSPADATMLRNYMVRKALELTFADAGLDDAATMELVLDRVDYNDAQVANLRDYLAGKYNEYGEFRFPRITHATHADSIYVDGLQAVDHLARLAHRIVKYPDEAEQHGPHDFLFLEMVVSGRPFKTDPEAAAAFSRRTRREE